MEQGASSAYDFVEEDPERAALLGALVSPDPYVGTAAGITEAFGYYPDPFNPGEYLPSVAGSIREGDYVGAGLTSLGAIPFLVVFLVRRRRLVWLKLQRWGRIHQP